MLETTPQFVFTYPAVVERIIDGDTIECHVKFSPLDVHNVEGVNVRVEGINAIELSQKFGGEARDYCASVLPIGAAVTLVAHKREKYGRFLAKVILADGRDLGSLMLTAKASDGSTPLAIPYLN